MKEWAEHLVQGLEPWLRSEHSFHFGHQLHVSPDQSKS